MPLSNKWQRLAERGREMKRKSSLWILMVLLVFALAFGGCSDNGSVSGDDEDTRKEQTDRDRDAEEDDKDNDRSDQDDDKDDNKSGRGDDDDKENNKQDDDKKDAEKEDDSKDKQPSNVTDDQQGQGSEKNMLVGTWVSEPIDALTQEFMNGVNSGMGDLDGMEEYFSFDESKLVMKLQFMFDAADNVSVSLEEKSLSETLEYVLDTVTSSMKKYLDDTFKSAGLDMSAEDYMKQLGISWDEFVSGMREEVYDSIAANSMGQSGTYEVRDGRIFMADDKAGLANGDSMSFEISGDKLTLLAYYNGAGELEDDSVWGGTITMPIVLYRQ